MNTRKSLISAFYNQKRERFALAVVWILSILLGVAVVIPAGDLYMIVNSAAKLRPKPCLLYVVNVFPVVTLVTLFAVRSYRLVYAMVFLYGLFRGFCGMCTVLAFCGSGWLVRCLLLFSSGFLSVLMWWLILFCMSRKSCSLKLIFCLLLLVSLITFLDYFVISPFLISIL